jgi:hypothetical protein
MGVQYSLWGGSVLNLGTSKHRQRFFEDINIFKAPGCFAMTELKHGSNVAMLQTQAMFDAATDEWVITTPNEGASLRSLPRRGHTRTCRYEREVRAKCRGDQVVDWQRSGGRPLGNRVCAADDPKRACQRRREGLRRARIHLPAAQR